MPLSRQVPYARLNLRRNPFGEFSAEERAQLAIVEIDEVTDLLTDSRTVVQFTGDKGFGKTTHLLGIRGRFPQSGYVHIPEGETRPIPAGAPILIDEAQRLTRWQRFRLFRRAVPLVLGTHTDFERELRRAGRNVTTVCVADLTSVDRLFRAFNDRIAWVRREPGRTPAVSRRMVQSLRTEFGPNIRGMLHRLYRIFESLDGITDV